MPVAVVEMLTADETVALKTLTKVYAPERPLRVSSEARPVYRFRSVEAGELHASRFSCDLAMRAQVGPFAEFMAVTVLAGAVRWRAGDAELSLGPGDVARYPTDSGLETVRPPIEPVTVHEIAEAARVTPRALHAGFRRHFGTTATGYLRRVRLERAHQDLRAADPSRGDTVSAVAAHWGFGHAARFTAFYREQYGVLPSRTLRA